MEKALNNWEMMEGKQYVHRNGNVYTVIMIANRDSENPQYPVTVVYMGRNGKVWAKPLEDFNKKMYLVENG